MGKPLQVDKISCATPDDHEETTHHPSVSSQILEAQCSRSFGALRGSPIAMAARQRSRSVSLSETVAAMNLLDDELSVKCFRSSLKGTNHGIDLSSTEPAGKPWTSADKGLVVL